MKSSYRLLALLAAVAAPVAAPLGGGQAIAAVNNQDPSQFVDTLADEGFSVLRTGDRNTARARFRTLLSQYFAIDSIGERLIRRWAPTITPAQRAAYKEALPNFIVGTYADRLFDYATADLKVIRTMPAGGGVDVVSQVTKPGVSPITTVWSVQKAGDGGYKVTNLKVGGINLAISQAADFDAIVQRKGFDALVKMMKSRS
jgi:phospholipid transport system substrate-binding protein